jgi:hypothetical protein
MTAASVFVIVFCILGMTVTFSKDVVTARGRLLVSEKSQPILRLYNVEGGSLVTDATFSVSGLIKHMKDLDVYAWPYFS